MDKFLAAIEALKTAKEELAKIGVILSWEVVAVNKSSCQVINNTPNRLGKPII